MECIILGSRLVPDAPPPDAEPRSPAQQPEPPLRLLQPGPLRLGHARTAGLLHVVELEPAVQARQRDTEITRFLSDGASDCRATSTTSRRNSNGIAFGMTGTLPARTSPHRPGGNQTRGSPDRPREVKPRVVQARMLLMRHLTPFGLRQRNDN